MSSSGYTPWSVTAGEIPTTAYWNLLGANDASFNTGNGFNDSIIKDRHIDWTVGGSNIWWEELGRSTLGVVGDRLTVTFTPKNYLYVISNVFNSGSIQTIMQVNNDSGANYALRYDNNNGGGSTVGSGSAIGNFNAGAENVLTEILITNYATHDKLMYTDSTTSGGSGAAVAIGHVEINAKWANTTNQISRIDIINVGAGDFDVGSELVVLGHN